MTRNRILIAAGTLITLVLAGLGIVFGPQLASGPRIVVTSPVDGAIGVNPRGDIVIELSQSIPADALGTITLEPAPSSPIQKTIGGNRILIKPEGSLDYNQAYRLTIAGLRNSLGRTMDAPVTISFTTVPYATVKQFEPADGTAEVALRGPITVEFVAPIVTAEQVATAADDPRQADALPQPLTLAPESDPQTTVPGIGRWLSPTLFGFYPDEDLRAATSYRASLSAEVSGDGRAQLQQPVGWSFRTEAPLLAETRPFGGEEDVALTSAIEVQLAHDVDPAAAGAAFSLQVAGGAVVPGTVEPLESGFRFRPATSLSVETRYEALLAPGITSRFGASLNTDAVRWNFTTIGDPEVLQVEPLPDTSDILTSTHRISVKFNHPIVALTDVTNQASLPTPLTITPPVQGTGTWLDTSTYVFSPTLGLAPSTLYSATVAAGLRDQTGGELRDSYTWNFATAQPIVTDFMPNSADAPPTSTVKVFFNQPMEAADVQANLLLMRDDDGTQVAGTKQIDGAVVTITPAAPLERGVTYRIVAPVGLRAAVSTGALGSPYVATFRVAPLPAVVGSNPANNDQSADSSGSIQVTFSTEMDWESVERNLRVEPQLTDVYTSTYQGEFYLYSSLTPEADYTITIGADARDLYGVPIGSETVIRFRTAPLDPSFSLVSNSSSRIAAYNASASARVPIQVVNLDQVGYKLSRLTTSEVIELTAVYDSWQAFQPSDGALVSDGTVPTAGERNRSRIALLDLGKLDAGLYLLDLSGAGSSDRTILAVSPYALTLKRSADRVFVWAADLSTGQPVANLDLQLQTYDYQNQKLNAVRSLGQTGADGVLETTLDPVDAYSTLFLTSPGDQPQAFVSTDWNSGISPWDFGLTADYGAGGVIGNLSTDKPIYRPEQTLRMRGVIRTRESGGPGQVDSYSTPAGERVDFVVSDPEGNTVLTRTLELSEFGTFNTNVPLDSSTPLGYYSMLATLQSRPESTIYGSFIVSEYRKPTFEITAEPSASDVIQGDTVNVKVTARYFAGGVLSNAPVQWRLLATPLFFGPEELSDYSFSNLEDADQWYNEGFTQSGSSLIADGTGTTDAQGTFTVNVPAELYRRVTNAQGSQTTADGRRLTIDVEITDVDGQVIAGQGLVNVHPAQFYIGLRPGSYVAQPGQPQRVTITTVTPEGAVAPSRTLQVEVLRREWYSVRERGGDGRLYWTSNFTDTLVQTIPASTDAQGRGEVSYTPAEGGTYRIVVSGKDDAGRTASSAIFSWAYAGNIFWGVDDTNRIDLISDKRTYSPGETASILVTAPYPGMSGLLTIERSNVIEHRLITLQGTSELIPIPIEAGYAPNVYVSLTLIKAPNCTPEGQTGTLPACRAEASDLAVPELRVGLVNLGVSTEQQELNITITPDKPQAGPRDNVTYTIKATDSAGAGVRAEVGLALVDKAVLSLASDPNPQLRDSFYGRRYLGVQTANTLTALIDRVTVRLQEGDKGGGGAEAAPGVRTDFPDTTYWNPSLVTGADGTAQVTVTLPDSLTTWRMSARALTADTRVGQATSDIIATKPLFARPALPRFLTAGDQPTLQAVIQNGTDAPIDATVKIEIVGEQASALQLDGPAEQTQTIPSGGAVPIRWPAKLSATAQADGAVTIRLTVNGGGNSDAVEAVLPIKRFVTPEVVASAGQVIDETVETIAAPSGDGQLDLELSPSLAAGIYSGLDYLQAFPYECTEQTISKFLPNAVTYRLFKQAGRDDAQLRTELEQSLVVGTQRLAALQQLDGGWGWWESDESNPYITTYVLQGLIEAQKAGLSVDQRMVDRGLDFLERALNGDMLKPGTGEGVEDARAYALFVLSEAGRADRARAVSLFDSRDKLQVYGRAYLLMTLQSVGGEADRTRTLIADLMSRAILTTSEAHWEERRIDYWTMSSNTRTSALALQALVRADPKNFLIPNATRYLMGQLDNGHWRTTQETALSTIALAEYVASSGELSANYQYSVKLGGNSLGEGQITQDNLADPIHIAKALSELSGGQGQLSLTKNGQGRLYYTLRLRTYADAATVQPLDRGISVSREYIAVASDTLTPTGRLVSQAQLGEVVQVKLTIRVPSDVSYLAVEDMLPAGLEALDASLKTVSSAAQGPEIEGQDTPYWWYYWARSEVRDDRVALFATELSSGVYTYTYLARATTPGVFQTLPATAYQMYAPEVFGRSAGATFTVTEP